jgi:hypothetical protein
VINTRRKEPEPQFLISTPAPRRQINFGFSALAPQHEIYQWPSLKDLKAPGIAVHREAFLNTIFFYSVYNFFIMVRRGSVWCGVAQLISRRLAVSQARVRFSARHHREVFPTKLTSDEEMERDLGLWRWIKCIE